MRMAHSFLRPCLIGLMAASAVPSVDAVRAGTTTSRRWGHGTTTRRPRLASTRPKPLEPPGLLLRCCLPLRRGRGRSQPLARRKPGHARPRSRPRSHHPNRWHPEPCREVARAMKRRKRLIRSATNDGASKQRLTVPRCVRTGSASSWTRTSTTGPLATSPFGRTTSFTEPGHPASSQRPPSRRHLSDGEGLGPKQASRAVDWTISKRTSTSPSRLPTFSAASTTV